MAGRSGRPMIAPMKQLKLMLTTGTSELTCPSGQQYAFVVGRSQAQAVLRSGFVPVPVSGCLCGSLPMSNVRRLRTLSVGLIHRFGAVVSGPESSWGRAWVVETFAPRLAPSTHEGILLTTGASGLTCPSGQHIGFRQMPSPRTPAHGSGVSFRTGWA